MQEFNDKYNPDYNITEVEDYDPEYDDCRYLMTHTYKDWTHPEAGFDTIDEAVKYIEWMEKKEAEENPHIIY